ncbi:MAG: carboxypeptidase regulatory-like domain-containing protein [Planctomycetes bacterium]|nr:carboxypeptidase regulatory-like domain-containing protein [Planctomycetota bacterium]
MKVNARTCWLVLSLTLVTAVTPVRDLAAEDSNRNVQPPVRSPIQRTINDVELTLGGMLSGQVVDSAGQPVVGQAIVSQQSDREAVGTRTDHEGRFRLRGLRAGICRIETGDQVVACRLWSPSTGPPVAVKELLLTAGQTVERGQRPIADLLTGPVLIGLIIAAAVAIPIAIHNSQKDAS